jgi:crotonobetainyl-CoA:carnitine CoA-transferase CaiB-like acyl-CoA transferase
VTGPLQGIRVLDLGVVLAGPAGAQHLADLGAEVIRVESIAHFPLQTRGIMARPSREYVAAALPMNGGYPGREPGSRPWNRFAWFNVNARNKLGMTVDLTKPRGIEIFHRLVNVSDVLVANQPAGTLSRLGLGYDDLAQVNPGLVYVQASSFGATGPIANYRAFGPQMEAYAGHDMLRHDPARDVSSTSWAVTADSSGAQSIAFAAQLALFERLTTGRGQYIDLSMAENFISLIGYCFLQWSTEGVLPSSIGNRDFSALQGCYPCAGDDTWVVLTLPDQGSWERFRGATGLTSHSSDPRFASHAARFEHHDDVDELISSWTRRHDRDQVVAILRAADLLAAPVLDDASALADPHLAEREYFLDLDQEDAGRHRYPGWPFRFREASLSARHPPVRLGEHNEYVYKEILGVPDAEYRELEAEGHIGVEYLPGIP